MMTKLRQLSKIFIIFIAVSFIALMVFEWGMDYTGMSQANDVVGTVNGEKLTYSQFSELYQNTFQNIKAQSPDAEFDDATLERIREQVWDQFIQRVLFSGEMERLGIATTDSEVVYQIYNYPLDDFRQVEAFKTNGIFDINKYHASFSDPNINWLQIEEYYRQQIPFTKLQNIITSTARVSEVEVMDEFHRQNDRVKVEYLAVTPSAFIEDIAAASEDEEKRYYDEHKDDYKSNEERDLSYILFEIKSTKQDSAAVLKDFEKIRERLTDGESFTALAMEYSADPSVRTNHGDLGYFKHSDMVGPFADAAFAANPAELVGPVLTSYGYHLILVEDKKTENGIEMVKASHILMKVEPAPSTVEEIENTVRLFAEDARDGNFAELAETNKYKIRTTGLFEDLGSFVPGLGQHAGLHNFAFVAKEGDVSGYYRTEEGYIVATLTNIKPAGYKKFEEVKSLVQNQIRQEKALEKARLFAANYNDQVKSGQEFNKIAANATDTRLRYNVTGLVNAGEAIPGVGKIPEFNGAAFKLNQGETSGLVSTERGFFYLHCLEKYLADEAQYTQQAEFLRKQLLSKKRSSIFQNYYDSLKEKAIIVDNRREFSL